MGISSDAAIDKKIIEMRKDKARILTIHNWLMNWDNFKQLDEQITLAHILNILDRAQLAVSRKEVRTCFNKYYNKSYHGDKNGYLQWLYKIFNIKAGTIVESSQARSQPSHKPALTAFSRPLNPSPRDLNQNKVEYTNGEKNGA